MGNFDGLHLGHAALIKAACARAQATGKPAGVLTFEPHPRSIFMPQGEPFRLTPFRVKEREIARLGVELLFVQHFDLEFAQRSAESFVEEVMLGAIGRSEEPSELQSPVHLVCRLLLEKKKMLLRSLAPVTTAVTRPPPAAPVTSVSASSCWAASSSCCIFCACFLSCCMLGWSLCRTWFS